MGGQSRRDCQRTHDSLSTLQATIRIKMPRAPNRKTFWRFWRRLRRSDSHASQNEIGYPPPAVRDAERKSALLEKLEIAAGVGVIGGVVAEDFDILHMILHPFTREGVKAIGGVCVALFIALEIYFSRSSANAEQFAREWYAEETERLRKENNETALLLGFRSDRLGPPSALTDAMKPFAGTKYQVQFFTEAGFTRTTPLEVGHVQWYMAVVLKDAGWTMEPPHTIPRAHIQHGVHVLTVRGDHNSAAPRSPAGEALAEYLDSRDIAVWVGLVRDDDLWNRGIELLILVGSKPETIEQHKQMQKAYREKIAAPK